MRIEAHDRLGKPINTEITRLVVYDDFDHPVAVAIKHRQGWIYVGHLRDPEFFDYLHNLGIDKTYVVDVINPKNLPSIKE